jgi:hypothetical protein
MDEYTLTLAREYVQLVEAMNNGEYGDVHGIDVVRQTTHDELCRVLGVDRTTAMYPLCKNMLSQSESSGKNA